ncbi:hypothetical protein L083_4991 [Actinoplanes sp. N902-109]|nr:hypothetical protein L083_4991 [Actinoplanes sp. N902-109]
MPTESGSFRACHLIQLIAGEKWWNSGNAAAANPVTSAGNDPIKAPISAAAAGCGSADPGSATALPGAGLRRAGPGR